MKLSHAFILGAAIMIAAPAYAQTYDNQRTNYDNQRSSERHVTTQVRHRYVAPRFRHVMTRVMRYRFVQEHQTTADLNRRSMQGQDSYDYNR
jgi:hypothetical protein